MYISAPTLDDLLRDVFKKIGKRGQYVTASRGRAKELTGVMLELTNPRARISRTETRGRMFSCLGELLWYLSGSSSLEFITYYLRKYEKESEDGRTVYGAYGPRLFQMHGTIDQLANIQTLLSARPSSRRAVIQLYDAADINQPRVSIPCTCVIQFLIRNSALQTIVTMRSNDAFHGLVHDIFAFTMLQEIIARSLDVSLGRYKHVVGSLHVYEDQLGATQTFLAEGWQSTVPMPAMPDGPPQSHIQELIKAESQIRTSGKTDVNLAELPDYWADLIRLLLVFRYYKDRERDEIERIKREISCRDYLTYIEQSRSRLMKSAMDEQRQLPLRT